MHATYFVSVALKPSVRNLLDISLFIIIQNYAHTAHTHTRTKENYYIISCAVVSYMLVISFIIIINPRLDSLIRRCVSVYLSHFMEKEEVKEKKGPVFSSSCH